MDNVSRSPSSRSQRSIRSASQSSGISPLSPARKANNSPISAACSPIVVLRKSGVCATSHKSRKRFSSVPSKSCVMGSRLNNFTACWSSAAGARIKPARGAGFSRLNSSASSDEKSRLGLRQNSPFTGSNSCVSICSINSSSNGVKSPVTPKLPSLVWRPARPAICANSAGNKSRWRRPSNLRLWAKATWSTSIFSPMPMASVATRKSTSPDWYMATCALRVRGLRPPITTAAPPRCWRIISAMA